MLYNQFNKSIGGFSMNKKTHDTQFKQKLLISWVVFFVLILIGFSFFWWASTQTVEKSSNPPLIGASDNASSPVMVDLTPEEQAYLATLGPVKICVDPDWEPYEKINEDDQFEGIAADLVDLIAERSGVTLELLPTDDWEKSLDESKIGGCQVLSFLNETPIRNEWLIFTDPYFSDPSVLITREEHAFISDLASLTGETMVLPKGTSTEERIRKDYPNIEIILVDTEAEAVKMVENREADMTLRSLTMAAYTIKKEGLFNLKVVGQLPNFTNNFRLGVVKDEPMLRDILNKGISTLTPQEVQTIFNKYISIKVQAGIDYQLITEIVLIFGALVVIGLLWIAQLMKFNKKLSLRQTELMFLSNQLNEDIIARKKAEDEILYLLYHDQLTGLYSRAYLNQLKIAPEKDHPLAVFMFDIDRLKYVNDSFGHLQGDELIMNVSNLFKKCFRITDTVVRIGGDEFVAIVSDCDMVLAEQFTDCIHNAIIEYNNQITEKHLEISVSVGYAVSVNPNITIEVLMQKSDELMYENKMNRRKGIVKMDKSGIWI